MPYVGRRAPIDEEQRRREEEQQRNQGPAANEQPAFGDSQQPGYQPEPQTYQPPQQPAYQPPQQEQTPTFQTYTGDYRTPFGQEDLDNRYKQTFQALYKQNPNMDGNRLLEDSFNITNRFAYQISDSVDAGIGNPKDYERNWEAANNWWQREVDRKNAQYFTEGKSYDELRQAWGQQGFRSDYQRRQDEAAAYSEWARKNRGQTAPQLMDDPFAQQAQEYADLLETMTRANEGQNVPRELLGRVDYIAKNQFGGDYTAAANWMRQQMEQYQALSRQTAEENARRTAEAQAAGQGAPVEDYETRNEWMEWARDHRDQRDEAAAFWKDPMATWRQMQETNINDLSDVQRDMWSRLLNVLPDETAYRLQAGMEPTEQDLQQISQAAQKQAGYLNDTRSIYGDAGQETETQKVYQEAMRQTPEGARQWLEEARGTGDEQKARDNLYFVENREKYNALDQQPDFAEKSQYDPNQPYTVHYAEINGQQVKFDPNRTVTSGAVLEQSKTTSGMTEEEKQKYNYLYATEGIKEAEEYLDYLQYALNERKAQSFSEDMRELGSNGWGGAALASMLSVPMGITRGLGYLETAMQGLDPSKPVDRNTAFNIFAAMGDAGREGVMQQVDWQANILGRNVDLFDFLYGTTMSGVDSMAAGLVGGEIGGALLLGSGAAQSAMQDIYDRGGSDSQALLGGLVSGVFESLFEKVSLGEFFEQAGKLGKQGFKDWMKNIGREAFVNFSEEFNTEVANILYDNLVNGDKSEYNLEMERLKDLGMTEKEAYAKVFWDKVGQALEAGAGGAVMGGAFGVIGNVNSSRATNQMNTESGTHLLNEKMGQVLKDVGMTLPEGSTARKMAEGYNTGKATAKQTGELYREIWNAVKNSPKMQDVMSRTMSDGLRFVLENDGAGLVSRDAADGLNAMLQGQEMTEEQAQAIAGSDVAMTMMHEMFVGEEAADAAARQREQEKKNEKSQPETPAERKNREAAHEEGAYRTEAAETASEAGETAEAAGPAGEERTQPMTPEERKNREAAHEEGAYRTQETAPGAADQAGEAQQQTQPQTQPMTPEERKNREAASEEGAYRTQEAQRQLEEADQAYRQAAQAAEDARASGESQDVIAAAEQRAEDARARYQEAQKQAADTTAAERKDREAAHEEGAYRTEGQRTVTTAKVGGQDSVVTGVQQDQDGHMTATTQDGRTVDLDEVDTDDARKTMLRRASRMDGDAAADMMNRYQEGQDADEYSRGYQRVYNGAKNGKGLDEIRSIFKDVGLTKEQAQAAWEAGMRARQAQQAQAKQRNADLAKQHGFQALEEDGKTRQRGVVFADVSQELTETQAGQLKIIDEWLRRRGSEIQVQVHDSITNKNGRSIANGKYDTGTNTIHLALDADNDALTRTASHEIYHYIQSWNGDAAKQLQKDVLDLLRNTEGYDLDKRIRQVQDRYRKGGKNLTEQQALDEITADSMLDVLGNVENMKALMKTAEPGTMAKIREWLQNAVKELQAIMQRVAKGSPEAKALLPQVEAMQRIQQQFEAAEQTASENYRQAQEGATRSAKENETVAEYLRDMQGGEDAQTALNGLVSQLFFQTQQEWLRQNMDADMDEAMQRFADALKRYRTENTALSTALEGAGFAAVKNGDMNTALSYAADQLLALEERTGEEAGVQYSFKDDTKADDSEETKQLMDSDEQLNLKDTGEVTLPSMDIDPAYAFRYSEADADAAEEKIRQRKDEIRDLIQRDGMRGIQITKPDGRVEILTPSIRDGVQWQLSYYGSDGLATMHENYGQTGDAKGDAGIHSMEELYEHFARMTFQDDLTLETLEDTDLDMKDEDVAQSVEDDAELFAQVTEDQDAREALELVNKLDESTGELTKGQWESRRGDVADKILQETGSGYSRLKLMKELGTLYQAMDDKTMDFGEKVQYAREIMRKVLNEGGQVADMDESTQEVLRLVRTRGFYLTDEMKSELRETGNSRGFYQKNFGRMALRQKAQNGKGSFLSLSELWTELNEVMPGAFPLDASEADMPMMLDAWLDHNGKKEVSSYYGRDAGAYATDLAYQAMLEYYDVPGALRKTQDIRKEFRDKLQTYRQTFQQKQEEKMKTSQERAQLTKEKQKLRTEIGQSVKYMNTRIVGQTDVRHVPEGLRGAAERAVRPFLNSTGVFDRQQLARLRGEYASMAKDGANHGLDAARAYDPEIQDKIERLERTLDGRRLSECTKAELEDIRDIVGNLKKMITEANEMQVAGRKTTLDAEAQSFMQEMRNRVRTGKKWLQKVEDVAYRNMTPTYYADKVGGVLKECMQDVFKGETNYAFHKDAANTWFDETIKRYHLNDWINDENHLKFKTSRGETIELSRDEAMALYATWKRETTNTRQNANHLRIGGFMYGKDADYDGVDTQAPHAVNAEDMQKVMDYLGKDQMAFVDEMVDYLSHEMADLGNETSMRLYGYKKFGEKYYYPYSSDNRFLVTELEEAVDTGKAGKPGFSKATVKNASNPVVLGGFLETWANHVDQMCLYNAFAEATDNLYRLYNYKTPGQMHIDAATGKEYVEAPTSLKLEMEKGLGEGAVQYLRTLVKDVNGGVRAEERSKVGKALSLFKKGSVAGNLSVVLQQPSAFTRAMNMVNPKYILSLKVGRMRAAREAMYKYSGVAIIKKMGRFDTGTGKSAVEYTLRNVQEKSTAKRVLGKIDDWTGWGAEKADEWTWTFLWAGVENEIREKMPELKFGSDEFYKAVGERFDDMCRHTQVYDSTLSKSEMMRSNSTMDKMVTSFAAEPTLTANMLVDALQNIRKPGGKAKAARAAAVFVNAAFVNSLLKSFATALRKGKDEDRTYIEKYLGDVTGNFLEDVSPAGILGLVPLARDVVSIFQGYDVERSDMTVINEVYNAYKKLKDPNADTWDQLKAAAGAVGYMFGVPTKNLIRDFEGVYRTAFLDAPLSETSGRDIKYTVADNLNSYWPFNIWDPSRKAYYDRIEEAMLKDDEGKAREMMGYMTETNGVKEETLKTGVKGEMKDSVARGLMSPERAADLLHQYFGEDENKAYFDAEKWKQEAEHAGEEFKYSKTGELMDAVTKGEDITDAAKTLTDHGKSEKDVLSAVKTGIRDMYIQGTMDRETAENRLKQYIPTMNDTDRYWLMDEWDFKLENGTEAKYEKYGKMWDAIDNGGDVRSEAQRMTSHGVKKENVSTAITKQYKQKYIDLYKTNPAAAADLKARILNAYAALGFDREKKNQDIAKWLK